MKDITKLVSLAVALVLLISIASAITEQPNAETEDTTANLSVPSLGNEGVALPGAESRSKQYDLNASLSGIVPFAPGQAVPYAVIAVGFREYIASGWIDEQTQIILLYHDMDELEAQMRARQFFTNLGEATMITTPTQMT